MTDKPSYFSILTAAVRYDKNLCANAKLLFSEITALTNVEGYCWASNKYFADLYDVDVSTVKRWISDLEKSEHIVLETKKSGMRWDRKIYVRNVVQGSKKVCEGSKTSLSKAQKEAYRGLKNEPIIEQDINNKKTTTANAEKENVVVLFKEEILKKTPLTPAQRTKLAKDKQSVPDDVFEEAVLAYLQYAKKNKVGNFMATITNAINGKWKVNVDTKEAEKKRAREKEALIDSRKQQIRAFKYHYENNRFWTVEEGHFVTFKEELTNSFTYKFFDMKKAVNVSYLDSDFQNIVSNLNKKLKKLVPVR